MQKIGPIQMITERPELNSSFKGMLTELTEIKSTMS